MPKLTVAKKRRQWHSAIIALMAEPTIAAAAARLKVHENTLKGWMRDPEFIGMFHVAQEEALGHGVAKLLGRFSESIDILFSIASDKTQSAAARVSAIAKIIDVTQTAVKTRSSIMYIKRLEDELKRLHGGIVEEGEEDTETQASRTAQRGEHLPPSLTGSFGFDGSGESASFDPESDIEEAEGDGSPE